MPESHTHGNNEQLANLQAQLTALKQENVDLHSRLQVCEHSQASLKPTIDASSVEHCLLEAIASATNVLTVAPLDQAVNTALQIISEALDTDRIYVIECFNQHLIRFLTGECCMAGIYLTLCHSLLIWK